jgi:hypothetical protein
LDTAASLGAISKSVIELVGAAFVDDTDLFHSGATNSTTGAEVLIKMQDVLDHWDNMLRSTGGALEKSKSYWYLLNYERNQDHWRYKPQTSTPGDIFLYNDDTRAKEPIERLSPSS